MSSSLRFPTNWVVYSKSSPLPPVTESVVSEPVTETPVTETPVTETPVVVDPIFTLEYFTTKPDEFTVPRTYGKFMEEYDSENKTNYYLSRLQLNHGQLACSSQLQNGLIVDVLSPRNSKNKLTLVLPYSSYRKQTINNKPTYVHTLNQVYDIVQPRNRPVEKEGKHRRHHHNDEHHEVTQ